MRFCLYVCLGNGELLLEVGTLVLCGQAAICHCQ
jgi:hypothetical protein